MSKMRLSIDGRCQASRLRSSSAATLPNSRRAAAVAATRDMPAAMKRVDFFVEMLADFFGEVPIHPPARQDLSQPVHEVTQGSTGASTRRMPSSMRSKLDVSRCR